MLSIKSNPWSSGRKWAVNGFDAFKSNIGPWIIFAICQILSMMVLSLIPFVGSFATAILPAIINGLAMRLIDDYHKSNVAMSFDMISPELNKSGTDLLGLGGINWGLNFLSLMPMLIIGVLALVATGLWGPVMAELTGGSGAQHIDEAALIILPISFFIGFTISLVLLVLVFMLTVFAPYLIVIRGEKVVDSLKYSFKAVQKNPWSITAISLWWLLFAFCGALLCGVGILVVGPIIQLSIYFMAEDIFKSDFDVSDLLSKE